MFWVSFPAIALCVFLAISVYHFSSDWRSSFSIGNRLAISTVVVCGPSIYYGSQISVLFSYLMVERHNAVIIILLMKICCVLGVINLLLTFLIKIRKQTSQFRASLSLANLVPNAELPILLISSLLMPPLLHFILYFCFLHSVKHFVDVSGALQFSLTEALRKSAIFVVLTLIFAYIAYYFYGSGDIDTDLVRMVFIGLFGLTVSHMSLITVWHRHF